MSIAANPTTQFVLDQFDDAYERENVRLDEIASVFMDEWPSERPTERYTYLEDVGNVGIWRRNESREAQAFRAVTWTTDTHDWQNKVEWHRNDDQDHQGRRKISQRAQKAATMHALMRIRVGTQMIESSTDNTLLPAIPTAPDGATPFATTAGGAARYGATNGNLLTGSGTVAQQIADDWFSVVQQFMSFTFPTSGNPLIDPMEVMGGITLMYPVALVQEFAEAFKWSRPIYSDDASLASPTIGAATSNRVADFNVPVRPFVNPYLSDTSDWYAFVDAVPEKAFYRQIKQNVEPDIWDRSNSDRARDEKIEAVGFDSRAGYGTGPTFGAIKVNNS